MFRRPGSAEAVYEANTRTLPSSRVLANWRDEKQSRAIADREHGPLPTA